jgi:hypothetical protein
MNLSDTDQDFLRDLIKTSRQRPHHVRWIDRDGTERVTTLSPADAARLNALAHELHLSKDALLRQATHLPARPPKTGSKE